MAATIAGVFEPQMQRLITDSRILLVGAGGIGCEVLKNLVLMGFSELEVIDLDTIEVSNLNRQFLFNKDSVGKPKCHVAKESVLKFNPNVNIQSHFGDIMDQKYGTAFFNKFKLVINALDNKKARSHVNRMCLSCTIPLIESGTMGYSGQVEYILKGVSLCYECLPKPEPKSYPMCTIRNTPKEPIHCITWAKYLFGQLFGMKNDLDEDVSMDHPVESANDNNGSSKVISAREWAKQYDYNSKKLFEKIFFYDIDYLLSMPHLYHSKGIEPIPLDKSLLNQERSEYSQEPDNQVLELSQHITMFLDSVDAIREKHLKHEKFLVWDKDDDDFMNFVVSSANIRSTIFKIPCQSHFQIKSMAGNIVPAIATANAMIAGQIVIHALRILKGKHERCQSVFLRGKPNHKGGVLVKDKVIQKPNPNCSVCSTQGEIVLATDIAKFTVKQFEELVLKKKLNMVAPDVLVDGRMIISSDTDDNVDMYDKLFCEVGILDGSRFAVDDFFQTYSIKIMLKHKERTQEEDPLFVIHGNLDDLLKAEEKSQKEDKSEEIDDDCVIENINEDNVGATGVEENLPSTISVETLVVEKTTATEINDNLGDKMVISSDEEDLVDNNKQEVSNEEMLAIKRKASEDDEVSEPKKSRVDE